MTTPTTKLLPVVFLVACVGSKPTDSTLASPPTADDPTPKPVAAAPAPIGKPRADLIPRALLFGNTERSAVQLSPDGKHLSWLAPKDGVMNVWIAPVADMAAARAITAETSRPIKEYFWAYTNRHVLYLQDTAGDENYHLFRVDIADGKTADLTPSKGARVDIAGLNPRFPTKLLIAINDRDPKLRDLHEIDILTGARTLVVQNDGSFAGYDIDNDMKVRLAGRPRDDGGLEIFEHVGNQWKPFDTVPFEDTESTTTVGFAPGNKAIYVSDTRGRDTGALVTVDLRTRKRKVLAEDARADAGDVLIHPTTHAVQAVAFEYDRVRWQVLDPTIAKDFAALDKLDGGQLEITTRTLDDKLWLVRTVSGQRSKRFYLWNRAKQAATLLWAERPELDKQPLVAMWPVEIKARDGLTLVSYLSLPAAADPDGDGKPNTPVPMVLFVHGGPQQRDHLHFNPIRQLLANRGYAVLSVNFRGSTGFGKNFLNAANLQWGKAMHTDLLDAVSWAIASRVTDKDSVCIMGGSYGGYATLVGLAMTPDVFRCGVDIVGISSLHTFIASLPPYLAPALTKARARIGDDQTPAGKALLTEASPLTHAANIKRPLLIGQGANDPRVKRAESEQIVAAMKKHSLPVTYVVFPDEGHGFARPENNIAFFAVTEAFLSAHLGGFYAPMTKAELAASSMQVAEGNANIPGLLSQLGD